MPHANCTIFHVHLKVYSKQIMCSSKAMIKRVLQIVKLAFFSNIIVHSNIDKIYVEHENNHINVSK